MLSATGMICRPVPGTRNPGTDTSNSTQSNEGRKLEKERDWFWGPRLGIVNRTFAPLISLLHKKPRVLTDVSLALNFSLQCVASLTKSSHLRSLSPRVPQLSIGVKGGWKWLEVGGESDDDGMRKGSQGQIHIEE